MTTSLILFGLLGIFSVEATQQEGRQLLASRREELQDGTTMLVYESSEDFNVPEEIFQYETDDDKQNLRYYTRYNFQSGKVQVFKSRQKEQPQSTEMRLPGFDPSMVGEEGRRRTLLEEPVPIFEKVFGVDEREEVLESNIYPYSAVGLINGLDVAGQVLTGCTGALVSGKVVITAAHCLYVQANNTAGDPPGMHRGGFQFFAGRSGDFIPYAVSKAIDAVIPSQYAQKKNEYDYGVIILDRTVGAEAGWLGLGVNCGDTAPKSINIAGYPYDKSVNADVMYKSSCANVTIDPCESEAGFFQYMCDTEQGMSGAPIWVHFQDVRLREVRGIHVQGRRVINQGVYISPAIFDFISREIDYSNTI